MRRGFVKLKDFIPVIFLVTLVFAAFAVKADDPLYPIFNPKYFNWKEAEAVGIQCTVKGTPAPAEIECQIIEWTNLFSQNPTTYYFLSDSAAAQIEIKVKSSATEWTVVGTDYYLLSVEETSAGSGKWKLAGIWKKTKNLDDSILDYFKKNADLYGDFPIFVEVAPPSLDDSSAWRIDMDDSECNFLHPDQAPEVTIQSINASPAVTLEEGTDFRVEMLDSNVCGERRLRIYSVDTSDKVSPIDNTNGYIERTFQMHYVDIADYYTVEGIETEYPYLGYDNVPKLYNSNQLSQTLANLEGYVYLKEKDTIGMGELPNAADAGKIPAALWNGSGFLKISYQYDGNQWIDTFSLKEWAEWRCSHHSNTVRVRISVDDSSGQYYAGEMERDEWARYLSGSIETEFEIIPFDLTETESGYPPTTAVQENSLFACINPIAAPSSQNENYYDTVKDGSISSVVYNGKEQQPDFIIGIYRHGADWILGGGGPVLTGTIISPTSPNNPSISKFIEKIEYSDNVEAGTGTITISFKGPYTGSIQRSFTIAPKSINDSSITEEVNDDSLDYTGGELLPELTVRDTAIGTTLTEGEDYQVAVVSGGTQPGTATLKITGINNYTGEQSNISYEIQPSSLADGKNFDMEVSSAGYTGSTVTPTVTVTDKRNGSVVSKDAYTVAATAGADNTNAGKGSVTITGKAPYSGTVEKEFTIARKDLGSAGAVTVTAENVAYNGRAQLPKVTVRDNARGTVLTQNVDYVLTSAGENIKIGTGKATVSGIGNYRGSKTVEFEITEGALGDTGTYEVTVGGVTYNGTAQLPTVTVTDTSTGKTLAEGTDYTIAPAEGADNVNAGTGQVSVTGISLGGTVVKDFTINPKPLDDSIAVTASTTVYNGKALLPSVTVTDQTLNKQLQEAVDFFVAAEQGADNVNVGTGKAVVTGIGNYTGTKSVSFTIEEAKTPDTEPSTGGQDDDNTSANGNFSKYPFIVTVRNQRSLRLVWEKREGYDGYQLYMATRRNGTYRRIATTSRNTAAARKLTAGTTYYFKVRAYKTVNGKRQYTEFTKTMAVSTKLIQPKITSAQSQKKGRVTLKWKRDSKANGYRIYVKKAGSSKFRFVRDLTGNRRISCTLRGLKSGKYVSVRIRSFKTVNGERLYSPLSRTVRIRVT